MTTASPTAHTPSSASVVLVGRLGTRIDERVLPSGDVITVFTIVVDRPRAAAGKVRVDSIPCQSGRAGVVRRLASIEPGEWVRAEGVLRRRFWRAGAGLGSAMEVDVSRLQREA